MWEVVLGEVAKSLAAGATLRGAGRLREAVARRLARRRRAEDVAALLADPERLERALRELVEAEPEVGAELAGLLGELTGGPPRATRPAAPAAPVPFVDRDAERAALAGAGRKLLVGQHGAGKTALVCAVAHDLASRWPDGQVYVDLAEWRDGNHLRQPEVVAHVLTQLGVEPGLLAGGTADLWAQYRAVTARRRFLLALDNARSLADVHALLPPSPASLVLVTAVRAGDLAAELPGPVPVGALNPVAALDLLEALAGPHVVAAERVAAERLAELCERMPVALRFAGERVRTRARIVAEPVAAVLAELRTAGALGAVDAVRVTYERTRSELPAPAAELCGLLAEHPGPDFTVVGASSLLGRPAEAAFAELADAQLLVPTRPGRYRLHHLVREVAARPTPDVAAADRLLRHYRDRAVAADLELGTDRLRRYLVPEVEEFTGSSPLDWLDDEREVLAALVREACLRGRDVEVVQLCGALERLQVARGHHRLFADLYRWGLRAAERLGTPAVSARLHGMLGRTHVLLGEYERAREQLDRALELVAGLDDPELASSTLEFRARWHEERGELAAAVAALREAVRLDRTLGEAGRRALGLHLRMLANVLVKVGRPRSALDLLPEAWANTPPRELRNQSRVRLVQAKAHTALGAYPEADAALREAWRLVGEAGATQYAVELHEVSGTLAHARGDLAGARWHWSAAWELLWWAGHPRETVFRDWLSRMGPS
ncbi:Tetratricopeptide repeat-containing protein [Amycolatopsis arida]|uniref:Tetratricopeptide repeat-containing protein n=1 Tax=Amycolatopsis arida TaxID=587909 RepID=A0A1I5YMH6_9PSEU|nr:hypothetical protein [Amycolatopsis arida]TDX90628.1 tetratricopeptide repeat protein [Amycolatopsis arida]SFQ45431.1 Tetratricopeptide repeat-containing protein [Amycolatopsis arida]